MRSFLLYISSLVLVLHSSCQQKQPKPTQAEQKQLAAPQKENDAGTVAVNLSATSKVPVSMVRHVRQARNGDILIASFLGVFRYDIHLNDSVGEESRFTNLTKTLIAPRFSSFWDVLEDRKGNLWFASRDSGVYRYDGVAFQHFTTKDGLASNMALNMYEDRVGNIWINGDGLSRYDGKAFQNFTNIDPLHTSGGRAILEDKKGRLWFGTWNDIFVYDGKTFDTIKNNDGTSFKNVWSILEDRKGYIWIGDLEGLWRYDGKAFTKVSRTWAYAMIQDKEGNIWTTGGINSNVWALRRYDADSLYMQPPAATEIKTGRQMDFLGIVEASDGSIWYGSSSGVHRYDGKKFTDF